MFTNAFRIGSIRGIAIKVDLSWFLIAALFALGFWGQFELRYGHDTPTAIAAAVVAAALFFLSVLAHELAHALEAQHRDVEVGGITLFLFGGVTETRFDVKRPFDEFALSAIGPYASLVLAALFGLVATAARQLGMGEVADVAGVLGWLNLLLAIFNMLPGAPLDGGRVLRAAAWRLTGDRRRAMRIAARAGQGLGALVITLGLLQAFVLGDLVFGLFNAFIGWFLFQAAASEHAHSETHRLLEGRTLGDVTGATTPAFAVTAPLDEVADAVVRSPSAAHPVHEDGEVIGVVHRKDVLDVSTERRADRSVSGTMRPLYKIGRLAADTPLVEALTHLQEDDITAVVDEDGGVVGLVTREDIERGLERLRAVEGGPRRRGRGRRGHIPGDER